MIEIGEGRAVMRLSDLDDRSFNVLLAEYEQLREDERHSITTNVALTAVSITIVVAIGAGLVLSGKARSDIPALVYAVAPLLPLAVVSYAAGWGVASAVRRSYMREVEGILRVRTPTAGWPVPSAQHAAHVTQFHGLISGPWFVLDSIALSMFGLTVAFPLFELRPIWLAVVLGVVYGAAGLYAAFVYILAYWRSEALFVPGVRKRVLDEIEHRQRQRET